jgi:excinuclease UvrABC nuclease subunit
MENEMKDAARAMQFERAAGLRDRIKRLKALSLKLG